MKSRMAITIGCGGSGVACGSQHRIGAGYHADRPLVGGAEQMTRPKLVHLSLQPGKFRASNPGF